MLGIPIDSRANIGRAERIAADLGLTKYNDLHMFYSAYENWPSLLISSLTHGRFEPILKIPKYMQVDVDKKTIRVKSHGKVLTFYFKDEQLIDSFYTLLDVFGLEQYGNLNVSGKDVVDIGANIGDTALYFAVRGAKQVYAYEPFPYNFDLARKNIKVNKLGRSVRLLNQGIGARDRAIRLSEGVQSLGSSLVESQKGKTIKIASLDRIAERHAVRNGILKLDCEGGEYGAILKAKRSTLRRFDEIIIEYHYGYKNLEERLSNSGFLTKHSWPRTVIYDRKMVIGMLYAKRI